MGWGGGTFRWDIWLEEDIKINLEIKRDRERVEVCLSLYCSCVSLWLWTSGVEWSHSQCQPAVQWPGLVLLKFRKAASNAKLAIQPQRALESSVPSAPHTWDLRLMQSRTPTVLWMTGVRGVMQANIQWSSPSVIKTNIIERSGKTIIIELRMVNDSASGLLFSPGGGRSDNYHIEI